MATCKKRKVLFVYVEPAMHEALRQLAFEDRISICAIARTAIGRYLSERAHEWHRKQQAIASFDETMASGIADGVIQRAAILKKQRSQES